MEDVTCPSGERGDHPLSAEKASLVGGIDRVTIETRAAATAAVGMLAILLLSGCAATSATASHATAGIGAGPTVSPSVKAGGGAKPGDGAVPTCEVIRRAFVTADVAVGTVVDKTAGVQQASALGSVPYSVERHCEMPLPGRPGKSEVEIDTANAQFMAMRAQPGVECADLPSTEGYGDSAFVCASVGSYYGIVGSHMLHIGPRFGVADVEHVAQNVVRLLK